MQIALPSDLERTLTEAEARLDLAIGMYASGRLTLARGAGIAGLSQMDFQMELGRRKIPFHYDLEELEADLRTLREITDP